MKFTLLSGDPGGSNFAYSIYDYDSQQAPAIFLEKSRMVMNTLSALDHGANVKQRIDSFYDEMEKELPEGGHLALERYIPRGMRSGVLSEVIPMMMGVLMPMANKLWLPQAAEWKALVNRPLKPLGYKLGSGDPNKKNIYVLVRSEMKSRKLPSKIREASPHLFDSSLIGLAYIEKELGVPTLSTMTTMDHWMEHIECLCLAAMC